MERISSRQNPIVKRFRAVADAPGEEVLLDGPHLLDEAIAAGLDIDVVAVGNGGAADGVLALAETAQRRGARLFHVSGGVLAAISPVRHPSPVVAIARRRAVPLDAALEESPQLVLLLSDIQDPGNVGAIIRAADACGATGVVAGEATADPFGWKALRGSMGSAFRIPVVVRQPLEAVMIAARDRGLRLLATVPRGGTPLPRCDLRLPSAVLLGSEGSGVPPRLAAMADEPLTIPMRRNVDSLNVATAAALIVYEALRQREGGRA